MKYKFTTVNKHGEFLVKSKYQLPKEEKDALVRILSICPRMLQLKMIAEGKTDVEIHEMVIRGMK